jgi:hypothetical protein
MVEKDERPSRQYPMTTKEAAKEIIPLLTEEQKKQLAAMEIGDLKSLHFNLGLFIRNKLGIGKYYATWKDRPFWDDADNESSKVIYTMWEIINHREENLK